jgi:hypothetical protein
MKMSGRMKRIGRASATALAGFVLFNVVAHTAIGANQASSLDANPSFSITSTISSSPTGQIPASLYPGTRRYLWYKVSNPQLVPITVNAIGISGVTASAGCSIANLQFNLTTFTGALVVPAQGNSSVPVAISLYDTNTNQDSCEGATFSFTYSGSATYTEVYATSATVTSSLNPTPLGQSVTYTATVTASAPSGQDPVPNSPTGSVTFMQGDTAIPSCSNVAIVSTTVTTAQATCTTFAYATSGTYDITADYTNSDGNFSSSTSTVFSQVVS